MPSREMRVMVPTPRACGCCAHECPMLPACHLMVRGPCGRPSGPSESIRPGPGCPQHRQEKEEGDK